MRGIKIFRDMVVAVVIGVIGGLSVAVISYYQEHKEGGLLQTAHAISKSFDTVAQAYRGAEGDQTKQTEATGDPSLAEEVEALLGRVEDGDETVLSESGIAAALAGVDKGEESDAMEDVLAIDGADGEVDAGAPYDGILRFHVRANSDSKEDQELKLAVKEDVVAMLHPLLESCTDVAKSKEVIVANLKSIYKTARDTIVEQGYDYDVKVYVTEEEFPAKTYGDLTFPAGDYQALRIDIGEAKGQNWWCVLFPPLCFVNESTAVVSEEGKEALKRALTAEEYEALFAYYQGQNTEEVSVEGASRLLEWLKQ